MSIIYDEKEQVFHLKTQNSSYMMQVFRDGFLAHLYYGKSLSQNSLSHVLRFEERAHIVNHYADDRTFSLETLPQEYPAFGGGDLNCPAYQVRCADGSYISDARYQSHKIYNGKMNLGGLPYAYAEKTDHVETLEVILFDAVIDLKIILTYNVFEDFNTITRSVKFLNESSGIVNILKASSFSIDFAQGDFRLLHLHGGWAKEFQVETTPLIYGKIELESLRGVSSAQHNPFFAILDNDTTEDFGNAYGFGLVYSGNFLTTIEVDQYKRTRAGMGLNPQNFNWVLNSNESFQTPEAVMVFSDSGIGEMSRAFHKFVRTRICKSKFKESVRPIVINSWEASYFNFDEESLCNLAQEAKEVGIELFVLDDGWFGKRNNDKSSLGDWYVNQSKIPSGISGLAKKVNDIGLQFGIWVEPEMISPDSELFRKNPEWRLHVPGRVGNQSRNQFVLDLSRSDVCEWIKSTMSELLSSANISYIKWDMNRHMSEVGSAGYPPEKQGEIYHRYVLGLYGILDYLTKKYPNILFESCEGGGGRFDLGMLHYTPQIWTSDNTDAIERLSIQFGASMIYPLSAISAHYSTSPNHQIERSTNSDMRAYVAMTGSYGYELNLASLSDEEKEKIKQFNNLYKNDREVYVKGQFYRLISPKNNNACAWMSVSEDCLKAIVSYFQVLCHPNQLFERLKLKGLQPDAEYMVEETSQILGGDVLMNVGLAIPKMKGNFKGMLFHLLKVLSNAEEIYE